MKVCHLISGDLWAGAEVMAMELLIAQKRGNQVQPQAIIFNEGRLADELRGAAIPVQVLQESNHSFGGLVRHIRKQLVTAVPDVVHSHRYKENLLAFLASRGVPPVTLVATQHGLPENYGSSRSWTASLKVRLNFWLLGRFFRKTVGVSEDIYRYLHDEIGFDRKKIAMVHNGLSIPSQPRNRQEGRPFTIGSSGRLFPVKDYPLMVEVARSLSQNEEVRFVLAGDGPEWATVKNRLRLHQLEDRFHLWGHLDQMDPFYETVDLYLSTSVHEGIPMAVLEAMARGIPVIAPRVGGLPEILEDGREGYLVEGREPARFAEKCLLLAKNPDVYRAMSLAARKRAQTEFSCETMAERYSAIYREGLAESAFFPFKRRGAC